MLADACRASLLGDVRDVLVAEIAEGRKDGVRSGLTESAEGSALYVSGEFLEAVDVFKLTLAVGDLREDLEKTERSLFLSGLKGG